MMAFLLSVHVLICLLLILAVLIQQGKGASMGLLSSAGQSWFGPAGSKSLLMKVTVGIAVAFVLSALLLTLAGTRRPLAIPPPAAQQ